MIGSEISWKLMADVVQMGARKWDGEATCNQYITACIHSFVCKDVKQ